MELGRQESLIKTGNLQDAIFNSVNFSSIATDSKGIIQIFNVGAEHMLGYKTAEVVGKLSPSDLSDPNELIVRAEPLSKEFNTPITPGLEALVYKATLGTKDIYELTYVRKNGSRLPAIVSVTTLRDPQNTVIGYLLIGTDNTARKRAEGDRVLSEVRFRSFFEQAAVGMVITTDNGQFLRVNQRSADLKGPFNAGRKARSQDT